MSVNEWEKRLRAAVYKALGEEITIGTDDNGGRVVMLRKLGMKITGNTGRETVYMHWGWNGHGYNHRAPFAI